MAKTPKTQGASEFQNRPGVDPIGGRGWRGVNSETNPSSLDPNELLRGDDVRLQGRDIVTRAGLIQKIDLSAGILNPIMGLFHAPSDNPRTRAWASARGCFGASVGTGARILHVDESEDPKVQVYSDFFAEGNRDIPLILYGGSLYAGDKSVLRRVIEIIVPYGIDAEDMVSTPPSVAVLPPFTGYVLRCGFENDGLLYLGLEDPVTPGASKIVSWNGIGAAKNELTGIRPPLAMGKWRDKLLVTFDATAGHIRVREAGTTQPGTWNTHALAGFQGAEQLNSVQDVRDKTYIASGIDKVFVFNGTALTLAQTIVGCDATGSGCTAVVLHKGILHYIWNAAATFRCKIGRQDPDASANEWVDTYKDVFGDQPNFKLGSSAVSYRSQILVGGEQNWLIATGINDDVQGSIYVLNGTGPSSGGFEIRQLVRFP